MQSNVEDSIRKKMEELSLVCDREIAIQQQRIDSAHSTFRKFLQDAQLKAQETLEIQAKLRMLKAELRTVEAELVKTLAAKTRKEAERLATVDSIAATKARLEGLKGLIEDQRARKNEYAEIISQQSGALMELEDLHNRSNGQREEVEDAISWYSKVLGFQIECGHGVKFVFTNIDFKNPNRQYSFTVRYESDVYTLLDCDPPLSHTKELLEELNQTNGLFKFVRTMRVKFQEATARGNFPQVISNDQDTSAISLSAPVSSVSTDCGSESPGKRKELQPVDFNRHSKRTSNTKGSRQAILSPGSASSLRRSPRFKVQK
ncbi:OLC1v1015566C1 [Oldenlandia corymbosa var. corymbosa]|uniref:Kinetochore protein SPC25 n=1 Tax=Oldenlandia corymbosa var. corymbosa TaxID=529605 RepID=A0AAV1E3L6_OLDCO|nr:OLC1v1015566C1 [Oldenlandia corymbosa var. corymbosa]